ncbi:RIP metalloprotease RseP [uncultured Megasphaera sp.]|uniref:RIP metalloprotease RseP n=1 Tax=uncultured Megasphaera sp. TaxID=165188 RepID=UPI00288AB95E|nr:RIP metalloprotease RseP [uncultured Megasphaera sp.]
MGITIMATIFVFSVIVVIHELGHFMTAKMTGMQVDEFAVGFGPKLISHKVGSTVYSLRLIPLGGFNRIAGMTDTEQAMTAVRRNKCFISKSLPARLLVMAAGALMNFILAICLLWGVFFVAGTVQISPEPIIGQTINGSPAARANLQTGDRILAIHGEPIYQWQDIGRVLSKHQKDVVTVTFKRQGKEETAHLIPETDASSQRQIIGIYPVEQKQRHGFLQAGKLAAFQVGHLSGFMVQGIYQMVTGKAKADLAGPIGIAQIAGKAASVGFADLLVFTAFLSTNLGIVNLLPVPLLDGGHIIILLVEAIRRKKLPARALVYVQTAGMVILGALFLFSMFKDITRLF